MGKLLALLLLIGPQAANLGPLDGKILPPTDRDRVQAGQLAPDFRLADEKGAIYQLSQYRGAKNVVLIFYKGYWCNVCAKQFGNLKDLLDKEAKERNQILALSPDDAADVSKMADRVLKEAGALPGFPLLSDAGFKVIDRYGLHDPELTNGHPAPYPSVFLIDREGKVRWRYSNPDPQVRASNKEILTALEELDKVRE